MSSLTLPMKEKLRKSTFTRSGVEIASVMSDELKVPITVPSRRACVRSNGPQANVRRRLDMAFPDFRAAH